MAYPQNMCKLLDVHSSRLVSIQGAPSRIESDISAAYGPFLASVTGEDRALPIRADNALRYLYQFQTSLILLFLQKKLDAIEEGQVALENYCLRYSKPLLNYGGMANIADSKKYLNKMLLSFTKSINSSIRFVNPGQQPLSDAAREFCQQHLNQGRPLNDKELAEALNFIILYVFYKYNKYRPRMKDLGIPDFLEQMKNSYSAWAQELKKVCNLDGIQSGRAEDYQRPFQQTVLYPFYQRLLRELPFTPYLHLLGAPLAGFKEAIENSLVGYEDVHNIPTI